MMISQPNSQRSRPAKSGTGSGRPAGLPRRLLPLLGLLASCLAIAGCAANKVAKQAQLAERAGRYDEAVAYYTRAVNENSDNPNFRADLARAKLRASEAHALEAARRMSFDDLSGAREELEVALVMNPNDLRLKNELDQLTADIDARGEEARRRSIAALKRSLSETALGGLRLDPEAMAPAGFVFRDASLRDTLLTLATLAGVNVVFDSDFRDQSISIDLRETTFEEAFRSLCRTTRNFYRVEGEKLITVIPDTTAKRRDYEQQVARTFYLSSADIKETIDLLRIVLGARRIAPHTSTNALTIVDTPERVKAAETIITTLDKSRSEVMVSVELLEVNRSRMDEYGIQLRSGTDGAQGITSGIFPRDTNGDQPPYAASNLVVFGLPGALLSLLRADSDTRVLAKPQLRAVDGQVATAEFGGRFPVPIPTFTPIAQGGLAQQPVTTFEYQNIGVSIFITPRVHHDNEVSLALEVRLDNISGTGFGELPTFGNRSVNTVLRLADGETSLLAGLIRDEERLSLNGTPGLASVPLLGRLFAANKKEVRESDIILTLTPRIVRRADLSIEDLRPHIIDGSGSDGGNLLYEPPTPAPRREPESEETNPPTRRPPQ